MRSAVLTLIFCTTLLFGQSEQNARSILQKYRMQISKAAVAFEVSPRLLASILYAEHSANVKYGEFVLDDVLARCGYNSSVGIGQVKVNTAVWIESQLADSLSPFFFQQSAVLIRRSVSREQIIARLNDPAMNLLYASAYIRMIQDSWKQALPSSLPQHEAAGIIATLYSLGLTDFHGHLRQPHEAPRMNSFGRKAVEFYEQRILFELFEE